VKAIFIDKLQGKTNKILKWGRDTCAEIIESIHSDYRALETGESMRDTINPNEIYLSTRRTTKDDASGKKYYDYPHAMRNFPHSVGNMLPRT